MSGSTAGRLPSGYFALIEKTTFGVAPDVVNLEEEAMRACANRIAVRDPSHEVVAVIEIVSPGNKSSRNAMKSFVEEAIDLLRQGVNLLIIDLFPPTPRDPQGIHQKIWSEVADEPFVLPADKPLTLAAYRAGVPRPQAFIEPVAVGDPLPEMPLFLNVDSYVLTPLEESYQATWSTCPEEFREQMTGPSTTGSVPAADSR